jgi:hypothetical protein
MATTAVYIGGRLVEVDLGVHDLSHDLAGSNPGIEVIFSKIINFNFSIGGSLEALSVAFRVVSHHFHAIFHHCQILVLGTDVI